MIFHIVINTQENAQCAKNRIRNKISSMIPDQSASYIAKKSIDEIHVDVDYIVISKKTRTWFESYGGNKCFRDVWKDRIIREWRLEEDMKKCGLLPPVEKKQTNHICSFHVVTNMFEDDKAAKDRVGMKISSILNDWLIICSSGSDKPSEADYLVISYTCRYLFEVFDADRDFDDAWKGKIIREWELEADIKKYVLKTPDKNVEHKKMAVIVCDGDQSIYTRMIEKIRRAKLLGEYTFLEGFRPNNKAETDELFKKGEVLFIPCEMYNHTYFLSRIAGKEIIAEYDLDWKIRNVEEEQSNAKDQNDSCCCNSDVGLVCSVCPVRGLCGTGTNFNENCIFYGMLKMYASIGGKNEAQYTFEPVKPICPMHTIRCERGHWRPERCIYRNSEFFCPRTKADNSGTF